MSNRHELYIKILWQIYVHTYIDIYRTFSVKGIYDQTQLTYRKIYWCSLETFEISLKVRVSSIGKVTSKGSLEYLDNDTSKRLKMRILGYTQNKQKTQVKLLSQSVQVNHNMKLTSYEYLYIKYRNGLNIYIVMLYLIAILRKEITSWRPRNDLEWICRTWFDCHIASIL